MRRTNRAIASIATIAAAGGLLLSTTAAALADGGSGSSPSASVSGWYRISSADFTSSICWCTVNVTSTKDIEYETDVHDALGFLVRATVHGPLISKVTRVDTGQSVVVDDTGKAIYDYQPDGSFTLNSTGHLMYGMHPGDIPAPPGLYNTSGHTVIAFTAAGQCTVSHQARKVENLCVALS